MGLNMHFVFFCGKIIWEEKLDLFIFFAIYFRLQLYIMGNRNLLEKHYRSKLIKTPLEKDIGRFTFSLNLVLENCFHLLITLFPRVNNFTFMALQYSFLSTYKKKKIDFFV